MLMRMKNNLYYFKLHSDVKDPIRATKGSACFDLHASLPESSEVKVYLNIFLHGTLEKWNRLVKNEKVEINSNERVLIPTGLVFDIPEEHSIRLYPRSSLALKKGLTLANNVGIIDSDYVEPVFMMVYNISGSPQYISNGERICQAELVREEGTLLMESDYRPEKKTDRDGGFGSTGKE